MFTQGMYPIPLLPRILLSLWGHIPSKCVLTCVRGVLLSQQLWMVELKTWSDKGLVNVWLTENCQCSMGWIKTKRRTERTLACWHVLLSAFQGGFSLFALLWSGRRETIVKWGWLFLRRRVNFTPTVWVRTDTDFIPRVNEAAVDPGEVQGFSESSVLNQTNTVEFLPLLVQRVEWQGCIAEVPVSRDNSGSKWNHPSWHCLILTLSHGGYFQIDPQKFRFIPSLMLTSLSLNIHQNSPISF